ncbi:MAG: cytochrome c biogenesis protein CcdA [Elusimicrobia bacterium]|nr:cytochrome c biogenesis protein CcdA [Elusimicrobiota bacterium]
MDFLTNIISNNIAHNNPIIYIFVLLAGIITSFTPCVFPVLPLIIGYIGALQVKSRLRAFLLSVLYVLGMSVTFSILGLIASLTGKMFGSVQSNPWTYIFVGNVILLMAMWFMDIIHISLPAFNLPNISAKGGKSKGFVPSFLLGLVSGIIAAPCTAAVLAIILTYVGTKQNVLFGTTLLLVYAFGLGTIIIIAGTFTGFINTIIKSETFTLKVKKIFGIAMFLLSQYFFIKAGRLF